MTQIKYTDKLNEIRSASQFEARNEKSYDLSSKTEKKSFLLNSLISKTAFI